MENNLRKNTIWNTIGITFNSFNSLFFLIIINRINGVDIAGIFSFAFSVACLLFIVGIYSGRTFQVSDTKEELNDKEYLTHKCITCAMMMILCVLFVVIRGYSMEKNLIIIILCLYKCLEAFDETLYAYLQKHNELHIVGKSLFFKSIVGIVLFGISDYLTHNIVIACVILTLNSLAFVIFYDIRKSFGYSQNGTVQMDRVLRLFKTGFSVFAFSFLAVYIVNIPKYVIDVLLSDSFQTIFGIIVMPGTVMSLCGQYILAPMLTEIVECYNLKNYGKFKKIINKIVMILLALGVIVEIGAALLGIPVLSLVYAIDLKAYKLDLLCIIFGAILYAVAGVYSTALITMRKNNMQLAIYLADSVAGVIVCYALISVWGIHGATAGYVVTMMLHGLLYWIYYAIEYRKMAKGC